MTVEEEIRKQAKTTHDIVKWALGIKKGGSSPYIRLTKMDKRWYSEDVVLGVVAKTKVQQNQKLTEIHSLLGNIMTVELASGYKVKEALAIDGPSLKRIHELLGVLLGATSTPKTEMKKCRRRGNF